MVLIDLALAGDNAVAVGMAAAGLPHDQRRRAIVLGLAAAVVMLIGFALITTQLLERHRPAVRRRPPAALGLLEDVARPARAAGRGRAAAGRRPAPAATPAGQDHAPGALLQILIADLSMSLDNVLAVAGAAREHPAVLVVGLLLSDRPDGPGRQLDRQRCCTASAGSATSGLAIVLYVALHMIWEGHRGVVIDLRPDRAPTTRSCPTSLDIQPGEAAKHGNPA